MLTQRLVIIIDEKDRKAKGKREHVTYVIPECDAFHYRKRAEHNILMSQERKDQREENRI